MQPTFYNTLSKTQEPFEPRVAGRVKLFTCGPSVYRRQHLGNYRTYLFEDVLHKYLEYQGYTVERLLNFTDVEDKAVEEARAKGLSLEELRRPVEEAFFQESTRLNIRLPVRIPRATTSVDSAVDVIQHLIARGHAYWHQGDVFFDPLTYEGFGRLFGLDMSRWPDRKVRFRKDTYPGQRWNLGDFILWHQRRKQDGDVWWDTAIGRGRPAWNIQDAAMIRKHLGDQIDIHTGGVDNLYRHHDYTLAIMESASGKSFCPFWLHGGHLLVNGEKMSKSKGNVAYLDDFLEQGFSARHIRFFLLYGPYREKMDCRIPKLEQCAGRLDRIRRMAGSLLTGAVEPPERLDTEPAKAMRRDFEERMNDNLDIAGAFDAVADHLIRTVNQDQSGALSAAARNELRRLLIQVDRVFGVLGCAELSG